MPMHIQISLATAKNWKRLDVVYTDKLASRANRHLLTTYKTMKLINDFCKTHKVIFDVRHIFKEIK